MAEEKKIETFQEFWPFYLQQHAKPLTRTLHYIGTSLTFLFLYSALVTASPIWFLMIPLAGYGFAWMAHLVVEKNRPATFTYPVWSLISDYRMFFFFVFGKLNDELKKANVPV